MEIMAWIRKLCTDAYNEMFMITYHLHIQRMTQPSVVKDIYMARFLLVIFNDVALLSGWCIPQENNWLYLVVLMLKVKYFSEQFLMEKINLEHIHFNKKSWKYSGLKGIYKTSFMLLIFTTEQPRLSKEKLHFVVWRKYCFK